MIDLKCLTVIKLTQSGIVLCLNLIYISIYLSNYFSCDLCFKVALPYHQLPRYGIMLAKQLKNEEKKYHYSNNLFDLSRKQKNINLSLQ